MTKINCRIEELSELNTLIKCLGDDRVKRDEPLSSWTTLGIGGKADLFFEATNTGELIKAVRLAVNSGIPFVVIGGGSNLLVGDGGYRGLVIKNKSNSVSVGKDKVNLENEIKIQPVWQADSSKGTLRYDFNDLNYDESQSERVRVTLDSGVNLQYAMNLLMSYGVTGLQWYARIPGTIGGAIYNNVHGGSHLISEVADSVVIMTHDGDVRTIKAKEIEFGYDKSRFHKSGDIILEVILNLYLGDVERAKATAREWMKRKESQPMNSAGCVFRNISEEDKVRLGLPTNSVGYIIEHVLKLGDFSIGGVRVAEGHKNFLVNKGGGTAKDFLAVKEKIETKAKEELGIVLEDEIVCLGEF